jgi:hypothetical protein
LRFLSFHGKPGHNSHFFFLFFGGAAARSAKLAHTLSRRAAEKHKEGQVVALAINGLPLRGLTAEHLPAIKSAGLLRPWNYRFSA